MKKSIFYLILSVIVMSVTFSGCKYEDGPFMSLRHKADRFTNVWKFTKVTLDGTEITDQYNRTNFMITFEVLRDGGFGFNYRDKDGKILDRTGMNSIYEDASKEIGAEKTPFVYQGSGHWTFVNNLKSVQMKYELSFKDESDIPVYDIKELRNSKMKLTGKDPDSGKEIELEFESL
ncbi:MAG: hypothetical protein M0R38_01735 [Bacteroidia bacterium]|nr:hypothetical protein [Bacteroidia bacterium]